MTRQSGISAAKPSFKRAFIELSKEHPKDQELLEAAFYAYAHRNPLIDRLFWGRLRAVESHLSRRKPDAVLDFGTGSGIMSYALAGRVGRVVATDLEPRPYELMKERIGFPEGIEFVLPEDIGTGAFDGAFDAIVALDVLEHMDDIPGSLDAFRRLLRPGGEVVISGPTENVLYKIGRFLAGSRFTGAYHVTDIGRIKAECKKAGTVRHIKTLYPLLPLFEIFSVRFD